MIDYDLYILRFYSFKDEFYCKEKDKSDNFSKKDLKKYEKYKEVLERFREYYGLASFDLKEIDRYLWQAGKEYFPKKYQPA